MLASAFHHHVFVSFSVVLQMGGGGGGGGGRGLCVAVVIGATRDDILCTFLITYFCLYTWSTYSCLLVILFLLVFH